MKIGLVDVDGKHYPNLALMKLSAWHKSIGDSVEFASIGHYDIIYKSKVFTFTDEKHVPMASCDKEVKGGTGYKIYSDLPDEIEHIQPDYALYNTEHAYGFLTRGCIRKCPWCIVPTKEGAIKAHACIDEFIGSNRSAVLMDNNPLASDHGLQQIERCIELGVKIDFNQGLDARIIASNIDIARLLSRAKWLKPLRMACDTLSQMESVEKATGMLRSLGCTPKNYFIYVLVKDIDDALARVNMCKRLGLDPFAQPYRDFDDNTVNPEASAFSRWVNRKQIFKTSQWIEYKATITDGRQMALDL